MPLYSYIALKQGKEVVRGEITASNLKDARDVVRKMGLVPTQINEAVDIKAKKATRLSSLSLSEKIDFISTLQILLTSGIPAVESLMFMEQEAAKKKIRDMSKILKTQIMAGSTFADTMARYPQVFGYIFIGLVKAGEESGELEKTLDRIKNSWTFVGIAYKTGKYPRQSYWYIDVSDVRYCAGVFHHYHHAYICIPCIQRHVRSTGKSIALDYFNDDSCG